MSSAISPRPFPPAGRALLQPTYSSSTNRYTAIPGASSSYDADGNLTSDSFHSYTWDAEGRPVTVDALGLTYDALGRLVEVKNGTSYTQYLRWTSAQTFVIMNGQTLSSAFVPLPGGAQVRYLSNGLSVYRMPDWLGSLWSGSNPNRTYNGSLLRSQLCPDKIFVAFHQELERQSGELFRLARL